MDHTRVELFLLDKPAHMRAAWQRKLEKLSLEALESILPALPLPIAEETSENSEPETSEAPAVRQFQPRTAPIAPRVHPSPTPIEAKLEDSARRAALKRSTLLPRASSLVQAAQAVQHTKAASQLRVDGHGDLHGLSKKRKLTTAGEARVDAVIPGAANFFRR
jgi:hypothetical protein